MSKLKGKHAVFIVGHEFEDVEILYPLLRLSEEGAKISIIPVKTGFHSRPYLPDKPVTGRFGHSFPLPIMEEGNRYEMANLSNITIDDVDCLIIPGGFSPDHLRVHNPTVKFVRECYENEVLIAAICHGPWLLVEAEIVNDHEVTCYEAIKKDMKNAGATFKNKPSIKDGNILTGRVPDDLPEFCQNIINSLEDK